MQNGDHWGILKFAGGAHDKTIINRMMLRFRPIAPKPVTGDSSSGESVFGNKNLVVTSKRAKRKYVRVCKKKNRKTRILNEAKDDNDENKGFVTLPLMPEKADLEKSIDVERSWDVEDDLDRTAVNNYHLQDPPSRCLKLNKMVAADDVEMMGLSDQIARRMKVLESWLVAESVTETHMDEREMTNCTDVEKMKTLEKDTCPAFVSDGLNWVFWVNQAYKNMVGLDGEELAEITVGLLVKDLFIFPYGGAFSCRVRLQYGDGKGKNYSKMVPCDVWKLNSGGFAWRLDVKAALSLGL